MRLLFALTWAALCGGCASTHEGWVTRRYVGLLQVTERHSADGTQVERVRGLGLKLGNGLVLGSFDDRIVNLPTDCRVVVLVKTEAQLQQWARLLSPSTNPGEKTPCARLLDF